MNEIRISQPDHTAVCHGRQGEGIARNSCDLPHIGTEFSAIRYGNSLQPMQNGIAGGSPC
jgi:hypothetical protein